MTKHEARAWAKARRVELDRQTVGRGMAEMLFAMPQWQSADTVLAFAAMPDEPDTDLILRRALAEGKRLLLPRVLTRTEMDWVEIPDLSLLRPGAYGISEPPVGLPAADPAGYAAPLALVPCLAASRDGVRLGRGGGYYDRFLAHYKGERLLLCPEAAVADTLPCDAWDARFAPEEILTEKGTLL
ncbi:5-formyltetrahydrofolate cyclo-ligase [Gemmiger sp.]